MLSIPKYPEQYAQHFPTIFYLLCCASQHHVLFWHQLAEISARLIKIGNTRICFGGSFICFSMTHIFAVLLLVLYTWVLW